MARRRKGQIVWVRITDLPAYLGLGDEALEAARGSAAEMDLGEAEIGFRHVGPVQAQRMVRALRRLRLEELRRVKALRAELGAEGPELQPELYFDRLDEGQVVTPDGEESLARTLRGMLLDETHGPAVFAGVRGFGDDDGAAVADQLDEVERLGLLEWLVAPAMEVQAPRASFRAPGASAGVARDDGGAESPPDVGE